MVHSRTAQQTRQLTQRLRVVLDQLGHGAEFSLVRLEQQRPGAGAFDEVGDQATGEADDEGATFGFLRMRTQEVRPQNVVRQQGTAAVSRDASPTPHRLSQSFFGFGQARRAGLPRWSFVFS